LLARMLRESLEAQLGQPHAAQSCIDAIAERCEQDDRFGVEPARHDAKVSALA
jgi:hypothetical protein